MNEPTPIRLGRATYARLTRLAADRDETIDETLGHAMRLLRQDHMGHDLARSLDANEVEWLDADAG